MENNIQKYVDSIEQFYLENGIQIDPMPRVVLDNEDQGIDNPFIRTGHFDPKNNEIVLFVNGRHLKDVLRTLCHELIHANQYTVDPDSFTTLSSGPIEEDPELEQIESDAFTRGNLMFRRWTEQYTF